MQDIPFKVLHLALVHWKCLRLFLSINPWSWTSLCYSWADSLDNSPGNFCCCLCPVCLSTTGALVQDPPPPSRLREFPRLRNWPPMRRRTSPIPAYVTSKIGYFLFRIGVWVGHRFFDELNFNLIGHLIWTSSLYFHPFLLCNSKLGKEQGTRCELMAFDA